MAVCINKNSVEYQSLKDKAGISELILETICSKYIENYGRFPHLDELPGANSSQFLKSMISLDKHKGAKIQDILEYSGESSIENANISINNIHRDLETEIIPIGEEAIVNIQNRPSDTHISVTKTSNPDKYISSQIWILQTLDKLAALYGIKINDINDHILASEEWSNIIQNKLVNGFIYNGEIYLNVDRASVDTPVHELMHLLIGSLRFTNSNLYSELIQMVENLYQYDQLLELYPNRTRNDVNEEIFITEFSKYITGLPSLFSTLSEKHIYEINYNVRRIIDSMLMGDLSTKSLTDNVLYRSSLKELARLTNSDSMNNNFTGTFNEEGSALHRKLNNMKSDLLNKGILKEQC